MGLTGRGQREEAAAPADCRLQDLLLGRPALACGHLPVASQPLGWRSPRQCSPCLPETACGRPRRTAGEVSVRQTPNKARLPAFWAAPPGLSAVTLVTFWPGSRGVGDWGWRGAARGSRSACSWRPRQVPGAVGASPGTCDPTTGARPAGGAWGGDTVPAPPSGTGTETSGRNSVCPEPRLASSCARKTVATEPFMRKGPWEPGQASGERPSLRTPPRPPAVLLWPGGLGQRCAGATQRASDGTSGFQQL